MVIIFIDTSFQRFEKIYMNQNSHSHIDDHAFAAGTNSFNSYLQKVIPHIETVEAKTFCPRIKMTQVIRQVWAFALLPRAFIAKSNNSFIPISRNFYRLALVEKK